MRIRGRLMNLALSAWLGALSAGCCCAGHSSQSGPKGLSGVWRFKDRYEGNDLLTFRTNGYEVDFDGDGGKDVWGQYDLNWGKITFTDKGGKIGDDCHRSGTYKYILSGDELKFVLISDTCSSRVNSLGHLWVRQ